MNCYPFIEAEKQGRRNVKRACEPFQRRRARLKTSLGATAQR